MARFRIRDLTTKFPLLEEIRVNTLATAIRLGVGLLDSSFDVARFYPEATGPFVAGEAPCIFAVYHGRVAGTLQLRRPRNKFRLLVSQSRDGEIVSRGISAIGYHLIRGSNGRGAVTATKQLIRAAREGLSLAMTVDGPKGPIHEVKLGIIRVAEMTGLPIIPSVASPHQHTRMWGWDKFMLCHWGTEMVYLHGEPIDVPHNLNADQREEYRMRLESIMDNLREQADCYWNAIGSKQEIAS